MLKRHDDLPTGVTAIEDRLRGGRFGLQDRPIRDLAVPLDQRRDGTTARDDDLVELPHGIRDRAVMAVDQQQIAFVVALLGMAGEMDLADARQRKVGEILRGGETVIGRGDEHVVDVEQQRRIRCARRRADEIGLAHRRVAKGDIGRRVFQQDRPPDRFLHLIDMIADVAERRLGVGQRQQIVEIAGLVRRPGEMLGHQRRLVALDETAEARKMRPVERLRTADRHAHAVQRHRMVAAEALQRAMRRSARAHVVLGMDFEEAALRSFGEDRLRGARA